MFRNVRLDAEKEKKKPCSLTNARYHENIEILYEERHCIHQQACIESPALIVGGNKAITVGPLHDKDQKGKQLVSAGRTLVIRPGGRFRVVITGDPEAVTNQLPRVLYVYPIRTADVSRPMSKYLRRDRDSTHTDEISQMNPHY